MIKNSTDKFWFALYTKPRNEFKAEQQLTAVDITNYLPTVTLLKQWSDRKKKVTEPAFKRIHFYLCERGGKIGFAGTTIYCKMCF